ncbi:uncharacterized protein LOC124555265 isoform X1 [Schistocerca americana]|uniref:uncharacterized protein LOC124555265 isoform X1 n=1 Tax=Schistocerca americana TaxID=7009 RepID=UPI001F4FD5E9|nr:uncharacterized protein LOC124555265 isoform X1 [Schistocerca americana]
MPLLLLLLPLQLQLARAATFTVDGSLAAVDSDCYERTAIGQRLPASLVRRTAPIQLVSDCEAQCDRDLDKCNAFSFGVSSAGNGSCELSESVPSRGALEEHPDYDVYVRKEECRVLPRPPSPPPPPAYPDYDHDHGLDLPHDRFDNDCYQLLGVGERLAPDQVRSSLPLQSLAACQHACSTQRRFSCHALAFRRVDGGVCELSSARPPELRLLRDVRFSAYQRETGAACTDPPPTPPVDVYPYPPQYPPQDLPPRDCFVRARVGFRLDRSVVLTQLEGSLIACEHACLVEQRFPCLSFSYRYSVEARVPQSRCMLSDVELRRIDPYTALVPDRDYDIYSRECPVDVGGGYGHDRHDRDYGRPPVPAPAPPPPPPPPLPPLPPSQPDADCFWRVRSGQRLHPSVVRDSLSAHSLGQCERDCLNARFFTCRTFSYRYGPPVIGGPLDNCQLSDWPAAELRPLRQLVDDLEYELYERGSYGRGCEPPFPIPPPQPPVQPGVGGREPPLLRDEACYVSYGAPAQLLPPVVKKVLNVPTEMICRSECTRARENFEFYCASLSFGMTRGGRPANCLLSDIEQRDLRPGIDFVHEEDNWLFAWNSRDPLCQPQYPINKDPPIEHNYIPHAGGSDTWSRFTVSGQPCRRGTFCSLNVVGGFWSCELEGGDAGAWDYCCRQGHHCGYSDGYHYPWCYVGTFSTNQWRPCSERYLPYPSHGSRHDYGPPQYWPVAYLHKESPPNATSSYTSLPFESGFHNYVDDRQLHAKNVDKFRNDNYSRRPYNSKDQGHISVKTQSDITAAVASIIKSKGSSSNSSLGDTNIIPSFDVVEDTEAMSDAGTVVKDTGRNSNHKERMREPGTIIKLQPRYVHETDNNNNGRLVRTWQWRTADIKTAPQPTKIELREPLMNDTTLTHIRDNK